MLLRKFLSGALSIRKTKLIFSSHPILDKTIINDELGIKKEKIYNISINNYFIFMRYYHFTNENKLSKINN